MAAHRGRSSGVPTTSHLHEQSQDCLPSQVSQRQVKPQPRHSAALAALEQYANISKAFPPCACNNLGYVRPQPQLTLRQVLWRGRGCLGQRSSPYTEPAQSGPEGLGLSNNSQVAAKGLTRRSLQRLLVQAKLVSGSAVQLLPYYVTLSSFAADQRALVSCDGGSHQAQGQPMSTHASQHCATAYVHVVSESWLSPLLCRSCLATLKLTRPDLPSL